MLIKRLTLVNYRNFKELDLIFSNGNNLIYGNNGKGKTNLVEAIYLLSLSRSFRATSTDKLIYYGENQARIKGEIEGEDGSFSLELIIEDRKKIAFLNNNKVSSFANFIGKFQCIVFTPDDLRLVKSEPAFRRSFIDHLIVVLNPKMLNEYIDHNRAIKNKNKILKQNNLCLNLVTPWNEIIAHKSAIIENERQALIYKLNKLADTIYQRLAYQDGNFTIELNSSFGHESLNDPNKLLELLELNYNKEAKRGTSLLGVHRDDIILNLKDKNARFFSSQGQIRSIVLSLKLAAAELIQKELKTTPTILLDDMNSELDFQRKKEIFEIINEKKGQVFITATDQELKSHIGQVGKIFHLNNV